MPKRRRIALLLVLLPTQATAILRWSDAATRRAAVGTAVNRYGKLDILVNNAGMSGAGVSGEQGRLEDATEAVWDRVLAPTAPPKARYAC
jgi:NAD(P)-dependent dehydrogenase (short-subunit alcohol dehydrogenase family)